MMDETLMSSDPFFPPSNPTNCERKNVDRGNQTCAGPYDGGCRREYIAPPMPVIDPE